VKTAALLVTSLAAHALASTAFAADAVTLEDYAVQPGDTCLKIARERFGDVKRVVLIHKYNPMGPPPHHLRPGMTLRLPPPIGAGGPDAELTFLRNRVDTFTPDRKRASLNEKLSRGHKVGTEAQSAAEVTFSDASRMELGENTLIVILGHERATRPEGTLPETTLVTGALRANLAALAGGAPAGVAKVRTDAAEVELGRGESKVSVDTARTTRLAVYRGRSALRASKKTVEVPEGYGSGAKKGEAPSPPRKLPAAPLWTAAPPERMEVASVADLKAAYDGGADGPPPASFRVQLARDERFGDPVVDTRVEAKIKTLEARGLPAGTYYARVSAIDADEFEGPFGKVVTTTVAIAPPPPPPPPPPLPPPPPPVPRPRRLHLGLGVLAGVGITAQLGQVGPRAVLEVEGSYDLTPRLSLALGLRGDWEYYDGETTDDSAVTVSRNVWGAGLMASVRYRLESARGLTPYLGVLGELDVVNLDYSSGETGSDWFTTIGPVVGAVLPLRRGGVTLEGLWRPETSYSGRNPKNSPIGAFGILGGYRLRF
jgi:hypothetical protein